MPDGDTLLTPGGGRWKANLREDTPVLVRLHGRTLLLWPELVRDIDEIERLLRRMLAANPRAVSFMPFTGPEGELDRERVAVAVAHGFRVVRWHHVWNRAEAPAAR